RVLYLDADMLCVGSLDGLAQLDMQDDIVAVAPDHPATTEKRCAALQLADPRYFNSGMLYINIPRWQEAKITEQVMQVLLDNTQTLRF
ncbi:glycosyltransferase, partial [Acinetobacter baumannii]